MKFLYHDLSPQQFEDLVVAICQHLLGMGVQGFSTGPDGGRDGRFVGRADAFPSQSAPWDGGIIIQAKHTEGINRSFSDPDFSGPGKTSVLSKELPRIRSLRASGELDFYILFANRKLPAESNGSILKRISTEADIPVPSLYLAGTEDIERFLKTYPRAVEIADINPFDSPLQPAPEELAEIVLALTRQREAFQDGMRLLDPIRRVSFSDKNRINGLTADYAGVIQRHWKDFDPIRAFLAAPENAEHMERYQGVADEFNALIATYRRDYHTFDRVLERILELLVKRDSDLRSNRKLTRTVLFYMYTNCDIGKENDDQANEARPS